jgi:hypothetical protein
MEKVFDRLDDGKLVAADICIDGADQQLHLAESDLTYLAKLCTEIAADLKDLTCKSR